MRLDQLWQDTRTPIVTICLILAGGMLAMEFTQPGTPLSNALAFLVDLRRERNLGTWLESLCMLATALPAYALARSRPTHLLPRRTRGIFILMACGSLFLAADEMVGSHNRLGEWVAARTGLGAGTFMQGFAWVPLYAPLFALAVVALAVALMDLLKTVSLVRPKPVVLSLAAMGAAVTGVLLLELGEAYLLNQLGVRTQQLLLVEESLEVIVIAGYYTLLQTIHNAYVGKGEQP